MGKEKYENKNEIKQSATKEENVFAKEQLISSKKFYDSRDVLSVVIGDNEKVSANEAQKRIENFKKGKVK